MRRRQRELTIDQRRKKVTQLYLREHLTQTEVANKLGVAQATVCMDVAAIQREYKLERTEMIDRETAELDEMEKVCVAKFKETGGREWIGELRQIKERKHKLLGLDAPTTTNVVMLRQMLKDVESLDDNALLALARGEDSGAD